MTDAPSPRCSSGTNGRHPIETLWREVGLPEYFLGNDGTNTKLYELYDRIRGVAQGQSDRDVLARKIWDADGPRYTGWPSDGYRVNFAHREQYPAEWNRCLHIADAILEIKDGIYVG